MHVSVLKKEILGYLDPKSNENFIDCTLGEAGHAKAMLEKTAPNGKVLGIDLEERNIELARNIERIVAVKGNFRNISEIVLKEGFGPVSGILMDLGMSSWHIDESKKGFSFLKNEPLAMRYGESGLTAEAIVNEYSEKELEDILKNYGEERFARRIARSIAQNRKGKRIKTTADLIKIIESAVPLKYQRINPATRVFQALRIAVNDELNNLRIGLSSAIKILSPKGKIAVISFHSLEDRIVKDIFKNSNVKIITKKPITPSLEEVKSNPRSRSAKLRVAEKI